jgi:hypothetical protein
MSTHEPDRTVPMFAVLFLADAPIRSMSNRDEAAVILFDGGERTDRRPVE